VDHAAVEFFLGTPAGSKELTPPAGKTHVNRI
jgi:hypothetical protein